MAKWIPGTAVLGLICLMVWPVPSARGVVIGTICVIVIAICALVGLLGQLSSRASGWYEGYRERQMAKRGRRAVHAGSGIARKL